MLNKQIITFCFLILFIFSCQSPGNQHKKTANDKPATISLPDPGVITKEEEKQIKDACQRWYDTSLAPKNFNGEMIVAKKGNIIFEVYNGTTRLPGNEKITAQTPLHIASVSKTFTSAAILKLYEQNKLNLDDTLTKYFPGFNYPGITIRSLLAHRSGLPNYLYFMEKLGWDKTITISNQDVLDFLINRKGEIKDIRKPNTNFNYCNTNYCLLALVIEKVSGTSYPDFLQTYFFNPLQMKNTFVFTTKDSLTAIPSYDHKGNIYPFNFLDGVYGDKNIYTTARDLLIWDRALTSNQLLNKETVEQAYIPYSNEKEGIRNYGLGWRMNVYPDGKKLVYHNGWWHGSNAVFMRLLQDSATIIVIGNKFNRSIYGARALCNLFGNYYGLEEEEEAEKKAEANNTNSRKDQLLNKPPAAKTK
ncbi:MAG: beta-lactamase family protein [Chitinophagaceae bacterium]|nr:beta-lactamase family protein [Chitinophagaceae bacterium]